MNDLPERPADITPGDWAVLRSLTDEWVTLVQVEGPFSGRRLVGRLQSLKARGLVAYRAPDHDVHHQGDWALTSAGDKIVWNADPTSTNARAWR